MSDSPRRPPMPCYDEKTSNQQAVLSYRSDERYSTMARMMIHREPKKAKGPLNEVLVVGATRKG